MNLRNSVGAKLLVTIAVIVALLAAPAIWGIVQLSEVRDIASELGGSQAAATRALGTLQAARVQIERYMRTYVAAPSPQLRERLGASLAEARAARQRLGVAGYGHVLASLDAALASLDIAARDLTLLVEGEELAAATAYLEQAAPAFARLETSLDPIAATIQQGGQMRVARARELSESATDTVLIAAILCTLLALAIALWLTGTLSPPLRRLRSAMAQVAAGRLNAEPALPYDRTDEIGDLARSYRSMTERLAELDRIKADFVGIASHELKTPIGLISGYLDLMEEALQNEPAARVRVLPLFEPIREQTQTLRRLVDHLLALSRVSAGGFILQPEELHTARFAAGMEKSFGVLARARNITLKVEVDETAPEYFWADPDCFATDILGNLIGNALKFTPPGGTIRVRFRGVEEALLVEVADTGPGIPDEQLPFIFEKYYQAGHGARRVGTGLGLAIVREMVELHGGRIGARSEPGRGTTFHILMPIRGAEMRPDLAAAAVEHAS
ncbi:MAG: ATP-binding protein [Longimicrobiales bacterium]